MSRVDELKAEIKELQKKYNLRSTSDSDKQIITDRIHDISLEIRKLTETVDKKVVPVIGNDIIANKKVVKQSSFINSSMIRL